MSIVEKYKVSKNDIERILRNHNKAVKKYEYWKKKIGKVRKLHKELSDVDNNKVST